MNFNPSAPDTFGIEFAPVSQAWTVIPKALATEFVSTATETIDRVDIPVEIQSNPGRRFVLDIYDRDDVVGDAADTITFVYPNGGANNVGVVDELGSTASLWASIDEAIIDEDDYIVFSARDERNDFDFATAPVVLTNRRITHVMIEVDGAYDNPVGMRFEIAMIDGSDNSRHAVQSITFRRGRATADFGEINQVTLEPWTPADIAGFDDGTYRIQIKRITRHREEFRVARLRMRLVHQPEKRVARGVAVIGDNGVAQFTLATPTGTDNWAKTSGTTYLLVLRKANRASAGSIRWRYVQGDRALPSGAVAYPKATVRTDGIIPPNAAGDPTLDVAAFRAYPLAAVTTAPAISVDSQPYLKTIKGRIDVDEGSATDETEFTPNASGNYVLLTLSLAFVDDSDPPADDLTVKIKRRSDNVQVGGDAVITVDDFLDADRIGVGTASPRLVKTNLASAAALVSGTQYYLDFTSPAATTDNPWIVMGFEAEDDSGWPALGFGGTTDDGTLAGTEADKYDFYFTVATEPTAPTAVAAAIDTQALTVHGPKCSVAALDVFDLTWAGTALGANFARYEIERRDQVDDEWRLIYEIDDEGVEQVFDYESRAGVTSEYRLRTVRIDEAVSPWNTIAAPVERTQDCGVYAFTSNQDPTLNLAYRDVYDSRAVRRVDFADADEVVFQQVLGRDGALAFLPTESRLAQFSRVVMLSTSATPVDTARSEQMSLPLRALSRATVPYVCVTDHQGGRWFSNVRVPYHDEIQPGHHYLAQIIVRELTETPFAVTPAA